MAKAPLTWTFNDRMTPSCGISTVASYTQHASLPHAAATYTAGRIWRAVVYGGPYVASLT